MMKAFLLFSTILLNLSVGDLPILNDFPPNCIGNEILPTGKSIKANPLHICHFSTHDTTDVLFVPEVHFEKAPDSYQIKTVVIDPGHGGHDPGCLGANSREKHIALSVGKYLADGMRVMYPGVKVIMTRSTDVFVPLHERANIATRNKADLFISIHCNAFSKAEARGIETYVLGLHATEANLEVAKRENEAILLEDNYQENYGYDPNSPEAHIMFSMFQNAFLEQSITFAEKVQSNAKNETGRKDRGVKQAGFLVLRHATMPSVLVETGYLTNSGDEHYLIKTQGQKEMANAILMAFGDYKYEMESGKPAVDTSTPVPLESQPLAIVKTESTMEKRAEVPEAQVVTVKTEEVPMAKPKEKYRRPSNLVISPPPPEKPKIETSASPVASSSTPKTNTSPTKKSKILATQPVASPVAEPEQAVQFCVQLAASPSLINVGAGKWTRLEQTVEVVNEGSLYKYQIRNFSTLDEANQVRKQIRSKGFSDAFVVAYKGGERVDPRKLK